MPPHARFFVASLAVSAAVFLSVGLLPLRSLHSAQELQARYPLVSMADRLAYEDSRTPPVDRRVEGMQLANFEQQVGEKGRWFQSAERTKMLKNVHRTAVQRFFDSPGFGRMRQVGPVEPDAAEIDRFGDGEYLQDRPSGDEPATGPSDDLPPIAERRPADAPLLAALRKGHGTTALDFVNVPSFGYVRDREHVAGFRPHGLHKRPGFQGDGPLEPGYTVTRLELVSLLKYGQPQVYILPHSFPRMDLLGDGPTRSLDAFEDAALARLQAGEDLVADTAADEVRLVGSIRAVKQCLACHGVERGEILGAFTYRLRKAPPAP
jgi:hypothetical protein